jgi:hypothetical protein
MIDTWACGFVTLVIIPMTMVPTTGTFAHREEHSTEIVLEHCRADQQLDFEKGEVDHDLNYRLTPAFLTG